MKRTKCRGSASVWWLAGLVVAMALSIAGTYYFTHTKVQELLLGSMRSKSETARQKKLIAERAAKHFREARERVPQVVKHLTSLKATTIITVLLAKDKITGGTSAQDYIIKVLEDPIIKCCNAGAVIYSSHLNPEVLQEHFSSVNLVHASGTLYSTCALMLEAAFLKSTMNAFGNVCGALITRLNRIYGVGAVAAISDGPFPWGDLIGVVLATGGTALCISDLIEAQNALKENLPYVLYEGIDAVENACKRGIGL